MTNAVFTHYWVTDFGWENTIYCPEDFEEVEILGENEIDGTIFIRLNDMGKNQIMKGHLK